MYIYICIHICIYVFIVYIYTQIHVLVCSLVCVYVSAGVYIHVQKCCGTVIFHEKDLFFNPRSLLELLFSFDLCAALLHGTRT